MPRQKRLRRIVEPPAFKGFKPYGTPKSRRGSIDLHFEEYEAIKLADYDLMNHEEAAKMMEISRATFARIYEAARRKIAIALVETRKIESVCGHARFDESWYLCNDCHTRFTLPLQIIEKSCPFCKSINYQSIIETS